MYIGVSPHFYIGVYTYIHPYMNYTIRGTNDIIGNNNIVIIDLNIAGKDKIMEIWKGDLNWGLL